jgi:hypothetical protein
MDKQAKAKRIGSQIGLLFVIGVIAYGAQLHRFFPFIGPAIGLPVLLIAFQLAGRGYGRFNRPKLKGLTSDELLAQEIRIAKVIRWFALIFAVACIASFHFL